MGIISFSWFSLAIISSILVSVVGVLQKIALRDKDTDPVAFSIFFQFMVGLTALIIAAYNPGHIEFNANMLLSAILMILAYAAASVLYYYSLKRTELSQVKIISSTRSLWLLIGGFIFLGEIITLNKFIGIILIILGIIVVYWQKGGFKGFELPQFLMVIYAVITAIAAILDKYLLNYFTSASTYMVLSYMFPALLTAVFMPGSVKKIRPLLKFNKSNFIIVISALLLNLATFSFFTALQMGGEISSAGAIWQSSTIFSVILGILILSERENIKKKLIGAFMVLAGVIFIRYLDNILILFKN